MALDFGVDISEGDVFERSLSFDKQVDAPCTVWIDGSGFVGGSHVGKSDDSVFRTLKTLSFRNGLGVDVRVRSRHAVFFIKSESSSD